MTRALIAPYLLTAPGRERILADTLASWHAAQSGSGVPPLNEPAGASRPAIPPLNPAAPAAGRRGHFGLAPLVIHHDPHREDPRAARPLPPMNRILAAYHSLLARAVAESTAPFVLLLEDDLAFAPGFPARLAAWSPLRPAVATGESDAGPALASFFRPRVVRILAAPAPDCLIADPASVIGSQALLLSRAFAARALAEWPRLNGFQSQRLAALAAELAHPIHYHAPSLVQHTGTVSAWGGFIHRAVDFFL